MEALAGARHQFCRWLQGTPVSEHLWGEFAVAFSELTANAVGAAGDALLAVRTRAWCEGTDVVLEVVNAAPGSSGPMRRWNLQDRLRSGGRGLGIVQALVDSVEVDRDARGHLVMRCRRSLMSVTRRLDQCRALTPGYRASSSASIASVMAFRRLSAPGDDDGVELCFVSRRLTCRRLLARSGLTSRFAVFQQLEDALQARTLANAGYGNGWRDPSVPTLRPRHRSPRDRNER